MHIRSQVFQVTPLHAHSRPFHYFTLSLSALCRASHTHTHNLSVVLSFVNCFNKTLALCKCQSLLDHQRCRSFPYSSSWFFSKVLKEKQMNTKRQTAKTNFQGLYVEAISLGNDKNPNQVETMMAYRLFILFNINIGLKEVGVTSQGLVLLTPYMNI